MSIFRSLSFALILMYLQGKNGASTVHKNSTISARIKLDEDEYPGYRLVTQGIEKTTFWTILCDNDTYLQMSLCSVHFHDYSFNGTSTMKKIEFSSEPRLDGFSSVLSSMKSLRLDEDKLLIAWIEYNITSESVLHVGGQTMRSGTFIKFLIVDFAKYEISNFQTSGTHSETSYHDLMTNLDIRMGKDSLDVFYLYSQNLDFAQERFRFDGRRIMGPLSRANFQIDDDMVKLALYVNRTNRIESWERFRVGDVCGSDVPCDLELGRKYMHGLTAARHYVTSCTKNSSRTWTCSQKLSSGASIFPITFDYEPVYFMIYNVYIERLLTMTGKLGQNGAVIMYLTMFDLNCQPYKPVQFVEIEETPSALQGHFFLNDDYDFCFSMLWNIESRGGSYNFLSKCYPKVTLTERT